MLVGRLKRNVVFLDRDGVINVSPEGRYVTCWEEFRFLPGALKALRQLHEKGWRSVIVSNQSGIGKGVMSRRNLEDMTKRMKEAVKKRGGRIDAVYYCTHLPESSCRCRKPRAGMIRRAARRFCVDLKHSFVIGDNGTDIEMGRSVGATTILVRCGRESKAALRDPAVRPDRVVRDLGEAVQWVLRKS